MWGYGKAQRSPLVLAFDPVSKDQQCARMPKKRLNVFLDFKASSRLTDLRRQLPVVRVWCPNVETGHSTGPSSPGARSSSICNGSSAPLQLQSFFFRGLLSRGWSARPWRNQGDGQRKALSRRSFSSIFGRMQDSNRRSVERAACHSSAIRRMCTCLGLFGLCSRKSLCCL